MLYGSCILLFFIFSCKLFINLHVSSNILNVQFYLKAAQFGALDAEHWLFEKGANPNQQDRKY